MTQVYHRILLDADREGIHLVMIPLLPYDMDIDHVDEYLHTHVFKCYGPEIAPQSLYSRNSLGRSTALESYRSMDDDQEHWQELD